MEPEDRLRPGSDDVAAMMRVAGLPVDPERLERLAALLSPALDGARAMDGAAERVALADAMSFDPAWPGEVSRA